MYLYPGVSMYTQGLSVRSLTHKTRCPECRKWIREKRAEIASKNRFQDSPSGPKFKTAIVAWAMCEGWWTEARNADEISGMQARGTKQREFVEDTPRELPWIESGSLVRDFGQQWNMAASKNPSADSKLEGTH